MEPRIGWMSQRHWSEVLTIEDRVFEYPFTRTEFEKLLRKRDVIGMVATHWPTVENVSEEPFDRVSGYMVYELQDGGLDLLALAVEPRYQKQGIGKALINKLKGKLAKGRRIRLTTEVRESNLAAQLFLKAQGFRCVATLKDHYKETDEAAYRFQYRLPATDHVGVPELTELKIFDPYETEGM